MPAPFSLDVYRDDLARIVESVFRTMMDLEAAVSEACWIHAPGTITSAVHFTGAWRGAVLVECGAPQACQFTARFMGTELPAAIDDDVRDVMGELANMVAGNLKSLLPRGVDLSMPSVVEGSDYSLHVCGVNAAERMTFASGAGDFRITLIEMLQPA
jgi:chemotaxis protein CheX